MGLGKNSVTPSAPLKKTDITNTNVDSMLPRIGNESQLPVTDKVSGAVLTKSVVSIHF